MKLAFLDPHQALHEFGLLGRNAEASLKPLGIATVLGGFCCRLLGRNAEASLKPNGGFITTRS